MKRLWIARDVQGGIVATSERRESIITLVRRLVKAGVYGRVLRIQGGAR